MTNKRTEYQRPGPCPKCGSKDIYIAKHCPIAVSPYVVVGCLRCDFAVDSETQQGAFEIWKMHELPVVKYIREMVVDITKQTVRNIASAGFSSLYGGTGGRL